ncbi:hypothetical protein GOBAR_AA14604 [Gossypium barbadense]|uniref:Uncharacterized protein n=1 Tax=Gossypium barbadense TaxID=3634 RepID=A0A2P5XRR2_GOSBA|nr:hypothetical protein GOBAR_AA14604 [Gossypium barbadense]
MKQSPFKLEISSKNLHGPCSSNNKGPIYEELRLQIDELDEWQTHKPRTHDKPKPCHDELNVAPKHLKVGDKVLLEAADPRIATSKPNEAIPLTVLSIFPYARMRSVNSSHHHDHVPERRALGRANTMGGDTTVLKQAKFFLSTGYDKWPQPCDVAVGESVKPTRACDTPVSRNCG